MALVPSVHHTRSRPSSVAHLAYPLWSTTPPAHEIPHLIASADEEAMLVKLALGLLPHVSNFVSRPFHLPFQC